MELKVIAYARNGFTDKFGIPRQSREGSGIETHIVFEPEFSMREAIRGIEGFSHLWLLWGFSQHAEQWSPTVRPPRLGGNRRMGVFATRSPFRPNPIGLSSVRLLRVKNGELIVSGADLMDGTPIYDIKPYLSYSDSHPDAQNGFAEETKDYSLSVDWSHITSLPRDDHDSTPSLPREVKDQISYILSQDPRPAYQNDALREYKIDYAGWRIVFSVSQQTAIVLKVEKIDNNG